MRHRNTARIILPEISVNISNTQLSPQASPVLDHLNSKNFSPPSPPPLHSTIIPVPPPPPPPVPSTNIPPPPHLPIPNSSNGKMIPPLPFGDISVNKPEEFNSAIYKLLPKPTQKLKPFGWQKIAVANLSKL